MHFILMKMVLKIIKVRSIVPEMVKGRRGQLVGLLSEFVSGEGNLSLCVG